MKGRMNKLLAVLTSAALMTGLLAPCGVMAETKSASSAKKSAAMEELARQIQDVNRDAFNFRTAKEKKLVLNEERPAAYDLRDKGYVTPVKFQNPFGSCWGFAAIAAAESSILSSGLAAEDGYDQNTLDLSEKHLINFHVRRLDDPDDPQNGEGMYFNEDVFNKLSEDSKSHYHSVLEWSFDMGGLPIYATTLFASGAGPNLENRQLPDKAPAGTPEDIYEYHGLNKDVDYAKDKSGKWKEYSYSAADDWALPEELRYTQSYVLKQSFMLPSPAQFVDTEELDDYGEPVQKYEYHPEATEAIKDQLLAGRAVEIGFHADQSRPDQTGEDGQYISKKWAQYTYEQEPGNHAVTIVGWDDDFPAEDFVEGHEPKDENGNLLNGAWLIKNSWGSEEREFPYKGPGWGLEDPETGKHTGYFWLSYYDKTLSLPEALEFEKSNVNKQYYIDEYDFMPVENVLAADMEEETSMANVFKAEVTQQLEQISCQTSAPGTEVTFDVFLLSPDFTDPEDGVKVASGSDSFEFGGLHKIALDEPVPVMKGQSYSIVVRQKTPEGKCNINLQMAYGEEFIKSFADIMGLPVNNWVKGVVNPKESYITVGGEWTDLSDNTFMKSMMGEYYTLLTVDNFPIKGYCTELPDLAVKTSPGSTVLTLAEDGNTATVRASFTGGNGVKIPEDPEFTWDLMEGGEDLIEIEPDPEKPERCTATAKKPGIAYIRLTVKDGDKVVGSRAVRVEVSKYGVWNAFDIEMGYNERTTFEVFDNSWNFQDPSDFTFTSDDPSIVTVDSGGNLVPKGIGKTTVRATDAMGLEAKGEINVVKGEQEIGFKGNKVSLKAASLKKKAQTIKITRAAKITRAKGTKTYAKVKGDKKIIVNKKTGLITVKKGLKKGTYKVKIKVTAKGNKYYKKGTKTGTVTIKIN